MLNKREIKAYTQRLDAMANEVQSNWKSYGLTKKAAYDFCYQVDTLADSLDNLRVAEWLEGDEDEAYMNWFNTHGVVDGPSDEPYMDEFRTDPWRSFSHPTEGETAEKLMGGKRASGDYWDDEA
jgi:hypothetical protein